MKRITKLGLVSLLMIGSYVAGDQTKVVTEMVENVKYRNVSAEDKTPKDYRKWHTSIEINNKGRAELYLTNDSISRLVLEDGTVGTCGEKIDEFISAQKLKIKFWYETLKEKYLDKN